MVLIFRSKLYNVIFPYWISIFIPPYLFIPLIGNLIIDSFVIYVTLNFYKITLPSNQLRNLIARAWFWGFFADVFGVLLLLFFSQTLGFEDIRIWESKESIFWFVTVILIIGFVIYKINYWLCLNTGISRKASKRVGLAMGSLTAPWMFLIPSNWFYQFFNIR